MVAFYLFYVIFVVSWHWWFTRQSRIKLAETAARLHHHIPDTQELEAPEFDDEEEGRTTGERTPLVRATSGESAHALLSQGIPAWKLQEEEDDETRDRYLAELQSNMSVRPPGARRNTMTPIRPSLIGALEFRAVLSSLEKKSTTSQPIGLRRYSEDPNNILGDATSSQPDLISTAPDLDDPIYRSTSGRNRAVSEADAAGLRIDPDLLSINVDEEAAFSSGSLTPKANYQWQHAKPSANFLGQLNEPQRPPSPKLLLSPVGSQNSEGRPSESRPRSPNFLAPPSTASTGRAGDDVPAISASPRSMSPSPDPFLRVPTSGSGPSLQVPILHSPHPQDIHRNPTLHHVFPAYTDNTPPHSPSSSRPPSIRLPAPSISHGSTHDLPLYPEEGIQEMRKFSWWPYHLLVPPQTILSTLFPTLYGWRDKSWSDKLLGIVTTPSVFLLAVTLPVVDSDQGNDMPDPDPALLSNGPSRSSTLNSHPPDAPSMPPKSGSTPASQHPHRGLSRQISELPPKTPNTSTHEISSPKEWNRWLVFVQVFTAPFFVVTILWANMDTEHHLLFYFRLVLGGLVVSLVCLFILLATTAHDRPPKLRPLLCFLGFTVAIAWISTIANEVVGVLKAFGVILDISDAILGLTIFAVGNSCGDLVADITVAKLGYPVMALSACFGGPMLNILLGIGLSGMYMTIRHGVHKHEKHPNKPIHYSPYNLDISTTLVISGVTLLVTLVGLLIVVPLNGWRMDRKIGIGLIALWSFSTIGNVIVEVLGYGETK